MPRPEYYTDERVVCVHATGHSRLHRGGERRAIIDVIIDNGGCMSIKEINEALKQDVRTTVGALCRVGWLSIVDSAAGASS